MKRAIRIGVTGMLGSGKSTLVSVMSERGMRIVKSDDLARDLMEADPGLRAEIIEILGNKAYSNGKLDRGFIASRIFSDKSLRQKIEAAVHPVVTSEIENIFRENLNGRAVAVESALILQTYFQERFDYIILVEATKQASIERAVAGNRMTESDAIARYDEQAKEDRDLEEADFIIDNSGRIEEFEKRCDALIAVLEAIEGRDLPEEPLHSLPE